MPTSNFSNILSGNCSTLVVQEHLSQIGLFLFRNGIEILLDSQPLLADKLSVWWHFNRIDSYFEDIWLRGAKTGEILLYVKPLPNGFFKIRYYDKSQFEYEADDLGLVSVTIKGLEKSPKKKKEFTITRTKIGDRSHSYGFVPCIVIQNRPSQAGRGLSEFDGFEINIERHDWLMDQIRGNIEYFGGPIFYSSRSTSELLETGVARTQSIAVQGGYGSIELDQTRVRAKRVIGGLEPGEQLGFSTPDSITPETLRWIDKYEAQLRRSMGGVPNDKTFGFTDLDVVSYFAQAINTAAKRAEQYLTNGIVEAFSMMFAMSGTPAVKLRWRYLGSLFPDTAQTQLTKSIVSRNLLRLGVNLPSSLQHVFPDKSQEEIIQDLHGGFAYELLNGVASVIKSMPEDSPVLAQLIAYLSENINGESESRATSNESGSVFSESNA
jgi:hypothetical protein